jgi:hypothetical protein
MTYIMYTRTYYHDIVHVAIITETNLDVLHVLSNFLVVLQYYTDKNLYLSVHRLFNRNRIHYDKVRQPHSDHVVMSLYNNSCIHKFYTRFRLYSFIPLAPWLQFLPCTMIYLCILNPMTLNINCSHASFGFFKRSRTDISIYKIILSWIRWFGLL